MLELQVTVDLSGALEKLAGATQTVSDLSEFWADKIEPDVTEKFQLQFGTLGSNGGTPWVPLRPATLENKARYHRADMGTLRFFDALYNAYTVPGGTGSLRFIEPGQYIRGVSGGVVPYARYHQTGWTATRWGNVTFKQPRDVPARQVLPTPVPSMWLEGWAELLQNYLHQKLAS